MGVVFDTAPQQIKDSLGFTRNLTIRQTDQLKFLFKKIQIDPTLYGSGKD
jgi:hypothetical protein